MSKTLRALENFKLSGITIDHYPGFVEAWAMVKVAAARANTEVGAMKPDRLAAIEKATQAVLAGKYHDQFLGRLVPGRRRHVDEHERQRGTGQHRAGDDRPQEG